MKKVIYFLLILFISTSCLTEIDFDTSAETSIVVSGVITNSWDERAIFVSRSKGIETEVEKLNATGAIYKDGEYAEDLFLVRPGELFVPVWFEVEEGATYHIEIMTEDEQVYRSIPQMVQPRLQTDSLSFELNRRETGLNSQGIPISQWYVDVLAHINIPPGSSPRYYKWHIDEVWSVESQFATCYVYREEVENPIAVVTSKDLGAGLAPIRILSVELDDGFFYKHYFNAYLHSIDETSYDFYNKVRRLTANTGGLYDELPAPVKGNIFLHEGTPETVLGNVEFSLSDTLRLAVDRREISVQLFNRCETAMPCPPPPPPGDPDPPCICESCLPFFGVGSLGKPLYWED